LATGIAVIHITIIAAIYIILIGVLHITGFLEISLRGVILRTNLKEKGRIIARMRESERTCKKI